MKQIILSRTDRIGDVILTSATFEPLRQKFPDASIRILVRPELVPLLASIPGIEAVPCPPEKGPKGIHPKRICTWHRYFKENPADCILFFHPDNDLQLAAATANIPRRIGYQKQLGKCGLNEKIPYTRDRGTRHEAACNFDLLSRIGCNEPSAIVPKIPLPKTPSTQKKQYAVFHPAAFGDKPRWSPEHYARLADKVISTYGWNIILIGSEPSHSTTEAFRKHGIPADAFEDRGGQDTLLETASLLQNASVVVSRDSGPAHLAAAVGAPLVCLMGQCDPKHSPQRWAALGSHTRTLISDLPPLNKKESRQARWKRSFDAITPDAVMAAIGDLTISR